ncbi:2,3-bisphosphoglycerate-independent phosphoglycerate mutase [Novimethylophilus kurashikiensis]|uniref:2,3-bisphosphoglycerate-independent phosphoglycerate mutase n=1 Tax=Novimethylophilus kurashikiensis TaxID=1825523 RepID=A0A2R5FFR2_9PROT|nr:2,3-bisphosphoglycerate-independent phosphoglycerate mutase [Novimethylophilus kurashikiensis]GBG15433.1 2,3-bisphosphoglycerate-independent phosphoglycerate mutase [Novimethylophilus kurashikiensis]
MTTSRVTPILLLILDGFGYSDEAADNAIAAASTPNWDALWNNYPHTLINASEHSVGLPAGQMGNSEVGHLNIGAGRVIYQDFERINNAIETGEFFSNPCLTEAVTTAKDNGKALHIFGLVSDGGVHSHESHIHAMVEMAARAGLEQLYVHAFLDGRDTPPKSAAQYLQNLEAAYEKSGVGRTASIVGRFYAMDRDKRWERVEAAYDLVALGEGAFSYVSAHEALDAAYARGESDEFVQATTVGTPVRVEDGDVIVYMNFRSDRARELTKAFLDTGFDGFQRKRLPVLGGYYTLTLYDKSETNAQVVFPPQSIENSFGEYVSRLGLKQLRIAETEKYPHVTFFFNGGEERVYDGEDRILVPSPKVATYDLKPEMSAFEVTDKLVEAILSRKYDVIICNYANADMVGHTGILPAAILAIEAVDTCVGRAVEAMQSIGGETLITADHGNAEAMHDHANHQPHTQHTTNLVPFLYVGRPAHLAKTGALSDIAPTMLSLMGLPQPKEMTGHALVDLKAAPTAVNAQ